MWRIKSTDRNSDRLANGRFSWSRTLTIGLCLAVLIALSGCSRSNQDPATATASPLPQANVADWLPTPAELPDDFLMQGEQELTLAEYAANWPDAATFLSHLRDWGFESGVRRTSWRNPAMATSQPGGLASLTTTAVAYQSKDAAIDASETILSMLMELAGFELQLVETAPLGDFTLAAVGTSTAEGQTLDVAYAWIVNGPVVVTYSGIAADYEPLADVLEIAEAASDRASNP